MHSLVEAAATDKSVEVVLELLENVAVVHCAYFLSCFLSHFRCQVGAEGCSGGPLSVPKERCEYSLHLGELIHDLLVG